MTPAEQKQFDDAFVAAQGDGKQIAIAMYELGKKFAAAPAVLPAELTDDQIVAIAEAAFKNSDTLNGWSGFEKDDDGRYTRPVLTPKDLQLCRVMLNAAPVPESQPGDVAILAECKRFLEDMHSMPVDWTIKESQTLHAKVSAALSAPAAPVPAASEGWISVDVLLPEPEVMVLICGALRGSSTGETYINKAIHSGGSFYSDNYRDEFHGVTHWMPLPAAPATSDKAEGI